ncbi:MAG TPA: amidase, partial [Fimbriimonadaceae bacterium]|nr:amidase [Fimbriimonadaceae bacterium]
MATDSKLSRADFLRAAVWTLAAAGASPALAGEFAQDPPPPQASPITKDDLKSFAKIAGLTFTEAELDQALKDIATDRAGYNALRSVTNDYNLVPPTVYRIPGLVDKLKSDKVDVRVQTVRPKRPARDEDVAFLTVNELGHLIRNKEISSEDLTRIYLARIKQYGNKLLCFVTVTEDLALEQARRADREIAAGKYRGPLHGIPYGIKDLFAVKGYPTQWGSEAFRGQTVDLNSAVFDKLTEAGAVCLGKTSLGALAMNDVWFGGRTNNPWNPKEGSSGS